MLRALHTSRRWICLLLAAVVYMAFTCASAEGYLAIVKNNRARVYALENLSGASATLTKYMVVTVDDLKGGIAKISLNGVVGYCKTSDIARVSDIAIPAVVAKAVKVYAAPSTSSKNTTLAMGTKLNVVAVSGGCAMVEVKGAIGYTFLSHLAADGSILDEAKPTPKPSANIVYGEIAAIVKNKAKVYEGASEKSMYLGSMNAGTYVTVHAYNPTWAYIELNGYFGFCKIANLQAAAQPEQTPTPTHSPMPTPTPTLSPTPTPTPTHEPIITDSIFSNASTTNEQKIYLYIVSEMGLCPAVACGILANMKAESNFRPSAVSSGGRYTGLCQWSAGRFSSITTWCENKGLDPMSLEGQMKYLRYDFENLNTKYGKALSEIDNTAQGAYDAGYYFCYNYERPSNKAAKSDTRGNTARDTYWAKYSN